MKAFFSISRPFLLRSLLAAALGSACVIATAADNALERAKQRGALIAGMQHVVPPYVAGAKFRTLENVEFALAEAVAEQIKVKLTGVTVQQQDSTRAITAQKADIVLTMVSAADRTDKSVSVVPAGYQAGPMAIMRTNTDIKTWEQLKGRKVCVAKDGRHVGTLARKYGANEMVFRAPADALLALRIGDCDAAVHDSALLEQLIRLPEWKKFSARLPVGQLSTLAFAVPARDTHTVNALTRIANDWSSTGYLKQMTEKMARNIAFEVYLDQNVPDCH